MVDTPTSTKKALTASTTPVAAYCFTLFSLACTAAFVLADTRSAAWFSYSATSSHFSTVLSRLFPNSTANYSSAIGIIADPEFGYLRPIDDKVRVSNESVVSNSSLSLFDKKDGHFPDSGNVNSSDNVGKSDLGNSNDTVLSSLSNSSVSLSNEKDGHFPNSGNVNSSDNVGKSSSNDTVLSSLSNSSVNFSNEKDGYLPNSVQTGSSNVDDQVKVLNNSISERSSRGSANLKNKKDGSFLNSGNLNSSNVDKGIVDDHVRVSNNSVSGGLSNSSVSSEAKAAKSVKSGSAQGVLDEGKMLNASVNGEAKRDRRKKDLWEKMNGCDFFNGNWVRDDSYPLYKAGSCPHIDEPFDCFSNGRPDNGYEKFRWQPKGCNIPRLNGKDMLEMLRGKRLVYVGDSLNRNMWESMVCTLRNAVKKKRTVFEASGRQEFRTEGSYSFIFTDYNCSVEFFRSTFLVREWEMPDGNGSKKETLRIDLVEDSSDRFQSADILVFNTGHWWTHEKTSQGKGYYQEGSHVYDELHVMEAFRKAMTTWGRWVDTNVDPKKTMVFFRGYSASHFSGGQWNSGGQCDSETLPITNEKYLSGYPEIMTVLEKVMKGMKTPVHYLNVTKMTDFRKDAHPSIYRSQHLSEEERRSPLRFQDCSHWCLPGVPETWNELLYAQIFTKYKQKQLQRTRH